MVVVVVVIEEEIEKGDKAMMSEGGFVLNEGQINSLLVKIK